MTDFSRREIFGLGAAAAMGSGSSSNALPAAKLDRPKLAVILTQYAAGSHGLCYCTKFLEGKEFDDHFESPRCEVVSIHLMEIAKNDIGVATAKRHSVPMYPTIATALCRGGDTLAVDGVVIIGEHGSYPLNEKGQQLYPRREIFDQVVNVFRQSGRVVPVFNDKHMCWNWTWAKYMWKTIQSMHIPWMAGSSLPYAKFEPLVPLPHGKKLDHVVGIGYGGLESYGFHSLETAQRVVECRQGGETGVKSVQVLSGKDVWDAQAAGRWPREIAESALRAIKSPNGKAQDHTSGVYAFDIEYRDGQRLTVIMANGYSQEFGFAYRVKNSHEIVSTAYRLDDIPRLKHFSATVRALEEMYISGEPTSPGERTLLTTGILYYGIESHFQGGKKLATPDLAISYRPPVIPDAWKEVLR